MALKATKTAQCVFMTEPQIKAKYVKRADELGIAYAVLMRNALAAYLPKLAEDNGKG